VIKSRKTGWTRVSCVLWQLKSCRIICWCFQNSSSYTLPNVHEESQIMWKLLWPILMHYSSACLAALRKPRKVQWI